MQSGGEFLVFQYRRFDQLDERIAEQVTVIPTVKPERLPSRNVILVNPLDGQHLPVQVSRDPTTITAVT
jgi:hypothetical protein